MAPFLGPWNLLSWPDILNTKRRSVFGLGRPQPIGWIRTLILVPISKWIWARTRFDKALWTLVMIGLYFQIVDMHAGERNWWLERKQYMVRLRKQVRWLRTISRDISYGLDVGRFIAAVRKKTVQAFHASKNPAVVKGWQWKSRNILVWESSIPIFCPKAWYLIVEPTYNNLNRSL